MKNLTVTFLLTCLVLLSSPATILTQNHPTTADRPPGPGDAYFHGRIPHRSSGLREEPFPPDRDPYALKSGPLQPRRPYSVAAHTLNGGVDTAWVRHYASGLEPSSDNASAMVIDGSGNVYVTGSSDSSWTGDDYLTVKFDASGSLIWEARYNGPASGGDGASSIAIDASGNIYVTGSSGSVTGADYATVKYDAQGIEQWVARYNGPGNGRDGASSIAVDSAGNVYVTGRVHVAGYSDGSGSDTDYATVKYNSDGVEQWVARYDGPGNRYDEASSIAVGPTGDIYVTGHSFGTNNRYADYATIKYNSAGVEQWVTRYPGTYSQTYDRASSIAVGPSGDVYVTGHEDSGNRADYATVKYSAEGVEQWVAKYNGPGNGGDFASSIAIDVSGNVHVTGISEEDYATVKYSSGGVEQWAARYDGAGTNTGIDAGSSIAVDNSGNVYVTGNSDGPETDIDYATIKYNANGVEQWVARHDGLDSSRESGGTSIAVDHVGNVYVAGSDRVSWRNFDYAIVKYNAERVEQWVARYDGPGKSVDQAAASTTDDSGNIYVTGLSGSFDPSGSSTVKYDADGAEQWVARSEALGDGYFDASALTVDAAGNVYVTGGSVGPETERDYATIKYNANGVEQWVAIYKGPGDTYEDAVSIATDDVGNVYVTGQGNGQRYGGYIVGADMLTVKYSPDGVEQWVAGYNGPENGEDYASSIAVGPSGDIYVIGQSDGSGTASDYATIKYSSDGVEQWVARYNGPRSHDYVASMVLDAWGNIYVTGESEGAGTNTDYATVKYNSQGVEQWVARFNSPWNSWEGPSAMVLDTDGHVYVTGRVWGTSATWWDYLTVKYDTEGFEQWFATYNGPWDLSDVPYSLAVDGSGNVYITGFSLNEQEYNYATVKYSSDGIEQWVAIHEGAGGYKDCQPVGVAVDGSENVYVTGTCGSFTYWRGYWLEGVYRTIKYVQVPVSVTDEQVGIPVEYTLSQNYPNPFNPVTTISYSLPKRGKVVLSIYNLLGEEIARVVEGEQPVGYHKVAWNASDLPSGIYLFRLSAGEFMQTRKMVL